MEAAREQLAKSHWWAAQAGADHVLIAPWWGAKVRLNSSAFYTLPNAHRVQLITLLFFFVFFLHLKAAWGKDIWAMAKDTAILATFDEGFAHDWKKVIVAPYVAHALLTKADKSLCEGRREVLKSFKVKPRPEPAAVI